MNFTLDIQVVHQFGIALLIGALMGIEREKRKALKQGPSFAGIRTFMLMAEMGAVSAWLSIQTHVPAIFAVALGGVLVQVTVAYIMEKRATPSAVGLTTELAGISVFLLGAAVMFGYASVAIGLAVINTALLAFKGELHGAISKLGQDDIYAGLKLLIASFIILPLLPDTPIDPWQALNPYKLWLLVILISALSLVGYVATRWLGSTRGVAITGLSGGLVSSTAVTLSMAKESREAGHETQGMTYAAGILFAWVVMFIRIIVMMLMLNATLLQQAMLPLGVMLAITLGAALFFYFKGMSKQPDAVHEVPLNNPFSLWSASKFAGLFAVVLVLVAISRQAFSASSVIWVGWLAGLTDVDAITLSMSDFAKTPGMSSIAIQAIISAVLANTLVKCGLAAGLGSRALGRSMLPASAVLIVAGIVGICLV